MEIKLTLRKFLLLIYSLLVMTLTSGCYLSAKIDVIDGNDGLAKSPIIKGWQESLSVSFSNNTSLPKPTVVSYQMASNKLGDILVLWIQSDGFTNRLYLSEYHAATSTWIHPQSVADYVDINGASPTNPAVVINNSGDAIIAWLSSSWKLFVKERHSGVWSAPTQITSSTSGSPILKLNNNGQAALAYITASSNATNQVFISQYINGAWVHPVDNTHYISVHTSPEKAASNLSMDLSDNGDIVVTWTQVNGSTTLYKAEYTSGVWSYPATMSNYFCPAPGNVLIATVKLNASGDAVVAWPQVYSSTWRIMRAHRVAGTWSVPATNANYISLADTGGGAKIADVAISDNGDAVVAWSQRNSSGTDMQLFFTEYRSGSWSTPTLSDFPSFDGYDVTSGRLAMTSTGDTMLTWAQDNGSGARMFSSFYHGSWTHPSVFTDGKPLSATPNYNSVYTALSDSGVGTISFVPTGELQLYVAKYVSNAWSYPNSIDDSFLKGFQISESFQIKTTSNGDSILTWIEKGLDGHKHLYVSEYKNNSWSGPTNINSYLDFNGYDVSSYYLQMDGTGNVAVVWSQDIGGEQRLFLAERINGSWIKPVDENSPISKIGSSISTFRISMNIHGDILLTWIQQNTSSEPQVFLAQKLNNVWTLPVDRNDFKSFAGYTGDYVDVSINDNSEAILTWSQDDGTNSNLYIARYVSGAWVMPVNFNDNAPVGGTPVVEPKVKIGNNGDVVIVFVGDDGALYQLFKVERRSGVWSYPTDNTNYFSLPSQWSLRVPEIEMNDQGDTYLAWLEGYSFNTFVLKAEYKNGLWTFPTSSSDKLSTNGVTATVPKLVMNSSGQAWISWVENSNFRAVNNLSGSWSAPETVFENTNAQYFSFSWNDKGEGLFVTATASSDLNKIGLTVKKFIQ